MICFIGTSFAAVHLREAARQRGFPLTANPKKADLIFISEDTPIDDDGNRDLTHIETLVRKTSPNIHAPIVLTSQVPPGFTRSLAGFTHSFGLSIYHQAETLRVKDAAERALNPEQHIIGCEHPTDELPESYMTYLNAFKCPIFCITWEEAEFSKVAINMTLAAQVDNTNRLAVAAKKVGANWDVISKILVNDKRIGPHSYLTPGRWQDSKHLLRDYVTLKEIENER